MMQPSDPSRDVSPGGSGQHFNLCVTRNLPGLARLGPWVDEVSAALTLSRPTEYALRLCLEEAAANIVMHGVAEANADANTVAIDLETMPRALRLILTDRCAAFDPLAAPSPGPLDSTTEARVGGLGLHLMRQYAASIRYEREADTNRLTLIISDHAEHSSGFLRKPGKG